MHSWMPDSTKYNLLKHFPILGMVMINSGEKLYENDFSVNLALD